MTRTPRAVTIALVALVGLSVSCDAPGWDQSALLREVVDLVIVPGHERLAVRAVALADAADGFCGAPGLAGLATAREAWRATFVAFEETAAYRLGPARDMNLADEMGFWPVSPDGVERVVLGTGPIDAHAVDALGAGSKGLLAIAYLLWGGTPDPAWTPPSEPAAVVALSDPRRCALLVAYCDHVERTSAALASAWRPGEGGYATTLATAGQPGNLDWPVRSSAVAALFTAMLDALKETKNVEIGIPIGHLFSFPSPRAVHSPFAPASVGAMQARLRGVAALWSPPSEHAFERWVRARDPELAATATGELDAAAAGLSALDQVSDAEPLDGTFVDYCAGADHAVGETAYARIDAAETTLATEVAARLGLSLAFSDMDGD